MTKLVITTLAITTCTSRKDKSSFGTASKL